MIIRIAPEPMDRGFQAHAVGTGYWSRGRWPDEAIGNLIRTCPEVFGVTIDVTPEATMRIGQIQEENLKKYLSKDKQSA